MIQPTWFRLDRHDEPSGGTGSTSGTSTTEPTTTTSTQPGPDPNTPVDFDSLPPNVRKLITDLRTENGKHRTDKNSATQAATEAQQRLEAVLKAAGLNPDGTQVEDPAAAAAQLAERAEAAEGRIWTLGAKAAIYDQAAEAGVNAKLVYNSDEFRGTLDDLIDEDPETPQFRATVLQKMRDYVAANPEYAATPAGPTGPRPDPSQGRGGQAQPTDFRKASKEDLAAEAAKYGIRLRS